ncbi:MAG: caspase family protein [Chloroflexales bacterium]
MDRFSQGHALLIGIGHYAYSSGLDIPETSEDVRLISRILSDPKTCAYPVDQITVIQEHGATRKSILDALDALAHRVAPNDTVFIFYSGHGEYGKDRSTYYLTTHDTKIDYLRKAPGQLEAFVVDETAVSDVELLTKLKAITAQRVFLFFNSCHAGSLTPEALDAAGSSFSSGSSLPGMTAAALLATGKGRAVITSCRENQLSIVGNGSLTIFGQALADGLRGASIPNREGFISFFDLYVYLYNTVSTATKPLVGGLRKSLRAKHDGDRQEPELTLLKNTGVLAVARHPGTAPETSFEPSRVLSADLPVREIDGATSRQAHRFILSGERSVANLSNIKNSPIVTGDRNKVFSTGNISGNSGQIAIGEGIAQATGGSIASVNIGQRPAGPQRPKPRLSDIKITQIMEAALQPDALPNLLFALTGYVDFSVDQNALGKTFSAQLRKLVELCREHRQRSALIESLLDINDRILGSETEQEEWRQWVVEQDSGSSSGDPTVTSPNASGGMSSGNRWTNKERKSAEQDIRERFSPGERGISDLQEIENSPIIAGNNNEITSVGDIKENSGLIVIGKNIILNQEATSRGASARQSTTGIGHMKLLRLFIASPGDVRDERNRVHDVIAELNAHNGLAEQYGCTLRALDWRDTVPGMGRPEQVILDQLPLDAWDVFVGVLWTRFGTPSGGKDPATGRYYDSGTQEEFTLAYRYWTQHQRPHILFYKCQRHIEPDSIDLDQYSKVRAFWKEFDTTGQHPGLYATYTPVDEFERRLRGDLIKLLPHLK